jgi:hypothetical protein
VDPGQLGHPGQVVIRDVDEEAAVAAQQPDDGRRSPVAQGVAGQLGGHQDHPVHGLGRRGGADEPVCGQGLPQAEAQRAQLVAAGERPLFQFHGPRGRRRGPQQTHGLAHCPPGSCGNLGAVHRNRGTPMTARR